MIVVTVSSLTSSGMATTATMVLSSKNGARVAKSPSLSTDGEILCTVISRPVTSGLRPRITRLSWNESCRTTRPRVTESIATLSAKGANHINP